MRYRTKDEEINALEKEIEQLEAELAEWVAECEVLRNHLRNIWAMAPSLDNIAAFSDAAKNALIERMGNLAEQGLSASREEEPGALAKARGEGKETGRVAE